MTNQIKVSQALAQVEGDLTPQIKVSQVLAQVECSRITGVISGNIGIAFGVSSNLTAASFAHVDISGKIGVIFGIKSSLSSVSTGQGTGPTVVIPGNIGIVLGLEPNLDSVLIIGPTQSVDIPGTIGINFGIKSSLASVFLQAVEIPGSVGFSIGISSNLAVGSASQEATVEISGKLGLLLGCLSGLVSNPLVSTDISGKIGLIFATAPLTEVGEDYETWVLNDNSFAPAAYTNWLFNSYAQYRGQYYAAGDAGLYLLGGSDQDGAAIHSGVRIDKINFGSARQKRLRAMKIEASGDDVRVRLATDKGDEGFFSLDGDQVPMSRNIQGREWVVDIQDFEELAFIEINPLMLVVK